MQEILRERCCGVVRCTVVSVGGTDLAAILRRMGLRAEPDALRPLERGEAVDTLAAVLWQDLAYGCPTMPWERAGALAEAFVAAWSGAEVRYYSNAPWSRYRDGVPGFDWMPLTDATFDGGLLIVNADSAACAWVEDED